MKKRGILLPVFSLPSEYGIGSFSKEALLFIDSLKASGQDYWQVLPLCPTGEYNSPYQSISSFAGNSFFIDPETLFKKNLLRRETLDTLRTTFSSGKRTQGPIDYNLVRSTRGSILKEAYSVFSKIDDEEELEEFELYCKKEQYWLDDYSLFAALSDMLGTTDWSKWPRDIKNRDNTSILEYSVTLKDEIRFYKWVQYEFNSEWNEILSYAHERGIKIIGDIPFYSAYESSDCYSNQEFFSLDKNSKPKYIAGCPPDNFNPDGQIWDNPVYDWKALKNDGYKWAVSRIKRYYELYDIVRIDHVRGFDRFFIIPAGSKTAKTGRWKNGPGIEFFEAIKKELGEYRFIAEDLGHITQSVRALVKALGIPSMAVLQFAFDGNKSNPYLPCNITKNTVVYTGTHDNDTIAGWLADKRNTKAVELSKCNTSEDLIRLALSCQASTAIIPLQDYLNLGSEARVNIPGTASGNWAWRLPDRSFSKEIEKKILRMINE